VNFYDWSNGFGVILDKFDLAAILENGGLQNSAIQLPPCAFLIMNFYASKDITHISIIKTATGPSICSWAKPKTRILATIYSAVLSRFTSFHHTNANEVSNKIMYNALRKCSNINTLSYEKL
jgi:hypothetical protein